jgi:hypothetical protein
MAGIGNKYLSLADKFKRENPDGTTADIIETLNQQNPMVQDWVAVECNDGTSHVTTIRTGMPEPTWKGLYGYVQPTKSSTAQVKDATGLAEDWVEVAEDLLDLSSDPAGLMLSEAYAHLEGMNQAVASTFFYGDQKSAPAKFTGLAPRFNTLAGTYGRQVVSADGVGSDNTSIWFVGHGENTVHMLYPKGTQAGLVRKPIGIETKTDADGGVLRVMREQFKWHIGLSVRDPRYVARVANIDVSDLKADASTGANLFRQLVTAHWRLHSRRVPNGQMVIYANPTILEYLDHQSREAGSKLHLTWSENGPNSQPVLMFRGIPIRETDALLNTEAAVA